MDQKTPTNSVVPIPKRMSHLPIERGYPVPWVVARDPGGVYRFAVNDEVRRQLVLRSDLCGICGRHLERARWFVGGPFSCFHEAGAYLDPPMHVECMRYAMQVCPYVALPSYRPDRFDPKKQAQRMGEPLMIATMMPGRPPVFVAVRSRGTIAHMARELIETVSPMKPFLRVEYWRHGKRLTKHEGETLAHDYMRAETSKPLQAEPRRVVSP